MGLQLGKCEECGKRNIIYELPNGMHLCLDCSMGLGGSIEPYSDGIPEVLKGATFGNFDPDLNEYVESGVVEPSDGARARLTYEKALHIADQINRGNQIGSIFYGQNGLGKSHLTVAIMRAVQSTGKKAMMVNAEFFYQRCQEAFMSQDSIERYIESFNVDLLVVDDCSYAADTEFFKRVITMLTYHTMDVLGASVIFTTNLAQTHFLQIIGDSAYDRVATYRLNMKFVGLSMRDVLNHRKVKKDD